MASLTCGGDSVILPSEAIPTEFLVVKGDSQTGTVGSPLPDTLVVQVIDGKQRPVAHQPVQFTPLSGATGSQLIPDTAFTDAEGIARTRWVLGTTAGAQTVRAQVMGSGNLTRDFTATALSVNAVGLAISTQPPATAQSTVPFNPAVAVQVVDNFGNAVAQSGVAVTASIASGAGGALVGTTTVTTGANGSATFSGLGLSGPTGSYTLAFNATGLTSVTSRTVLLLAGTASKLALTTQPSSSAASGQVFTQQPVVQAQDAAGNPVGVANLAVTVSITPPGTGTLGGTLTVNTNASGVATFTNLSLTGLAGVRTLTFSTPTLTSVTSSPISIGASVATQIAANSPTALTGTAGTAVSPPPSVIVKDASGNPVAGVPVTFTVDSGGGSVTPVGGSVLTDGTGVATVGSWTLGTNPAVTNRLSASSAGLTGSPVIFRATAAAGSAAKLAFVQQPTNAVAGSAIAPAVTIVVQDANGNTVTSSTASITLAIGTNPGGGVLGGTATVAAVAGIATFSTLNINKVGTGYTLNATSGTLTGATSTAFNITAGTAAKLAFVQQPTNAVAGSAIAPAVTVVVQDANGNTVTSSTASITLAIGTNPGGGVLGGTATVAAVAGIATFSNLSINKVGAGYTLNATSGTLTAAGSTPFNITPAAASQLAWSVQPANAVAGSPIPPPPQVAVLDAFGNVVTTSTASITVAFGANPGGGSLTGTTTVNAVNGTATFSNLVIMVAQNGYSLIASSTGPTSATSNLFNVVVGSGNKLVFAGCVPATACTQPSNVLVGAPITPAVKVAIVDASNNVVTTATDSIQLVLSAGPGVLGGTTGARAVAGVATFSNLTVSAASTGRTLSAFAPAGALNSVTSTAFNVTAASTTTTITGDTPDPSTAGQAYTVTFTVAPVAPGAGTPTGAVTVSDGTGATCGPVTLAAGTGSCSLTSTTVATTTPKTLTATYPGDGNFLASSGTTTHTVNPAPTTTTVTDSPDPSVTGQPVTVSVTVAGGPTPTGTVNVTDGTISCPVTLASGSGSCNLTFTTAGARTLTATYVPDANHAASSGTMAHTVNPATTTTTVTSSLNPSTLGQSVTFTATVAVTAPGAGTMTGTVQFKDGATNLGSPVTLSGGVATLATTALTGGSHSITAVYSGDANFATSTSSALTQTVNAAATTTSVVSSANPSVFGQSVTFTATVTGSGGTPTGTVQFRDGATVLGTSSLSGNTAQFTISTLSAASHSITAVYNGDANFASSTSTVLTQTVNKAATTTGVTSSVNPSVFGQSVTFTATVAVTAPGTGTPTGTVQFLDGATVLGAPSLSGNTAQFTTSALSVAGHSITAVYGGDGSFLSSTSTVLTQTVNKAATTTGVTSSVNPSTSGQSVTFTATVAVTAPGAGTPTGTVQFLDGVTVLGAPSLSGNTAQFTTTALSVGSHSITAVYSGDANLTTSTSAVLTQTVNASGSTTTITSDTPDPSVVGQTVTVGFTVSGAPGTPTGTVTVTVNDGSGVSCTGTLSSGAGSCTLAFTSPGAKTLTATYSGDGTHAGSTSVGVSHTVNQASTTTTITSDSPDPSVVGQAYTANFTVVAAAPGAGIPTGNVTVSDATGATCTATVAAGSCSLTSTTAGAKTLTATYAGDANFLTSSGTMSHTVNPASTTTTISSQSAATTVVGQAYTVNFTVAAVAPGAGTPTGNVTVSDGTGVTCTGALSSGTGSCSLTSTTAGAKTLTASYTATTNFAASTSAGVGHTVNPASTTTTISSQSATTTVVGQAYTVNFTVAAVAPGSGTVTGNVTVSDGTGATCTGALSSGAGSCSLTSTTAGSKTLTASYTATANFAASTSAGAGHTVNAAATTTTIANITPNTSQVGNAITVSFSVAVNSPGSGTPTGSVTASDGTNSCTDTIAVGSCSFIPATAVAATITVTASYAGDGNFAGSTSAGVLHQVN